MRLIADDAVAYPRCRQFLFPLDWNNALHCPEVLRTQRLLTKRCAVRADEQQSPGTGVMNLLHSQASNARKRLSQTSIPF